MLLFTTTLAPSLWLARSTWYTEICCITIKNVQNYLPTTKNCTCINTFFDTLFINPFKILVKRIFYVLICFVVAWVPFEIINLFASLLAFDWWNNFFFFFIIYIYFFLAVQIFVSWLLCIFLGNSTLALNDCCIFCVDDIKFTFRQWRHQSFIISRLRECQFNYCDSFFFIGTPARIIVEKLRPLVVNF